MVPVRSSWGRSSEIKLVQSLGLVDEAPGEHSHVLPRHHLVHGHVGGGAHLGHQLDNLPQLDQLAAPHQLHLGVELRQAEVDVLVVQERRAEGLALPGVEGLGEVEHLV